MMTPLEQVPLKVRPQPIRQNGDIQIVADVAQLPYLQLGQKLSLVDKHAVNDLDRMLFFHETEQVVGCRNRNRFRL